MNSTLTECEAGLRRLRHGYPSRRRPASLSARDGFSRVLDAVAMVVLSAGLSWIGADPAAASTPLIDVHAQYPAIRVELSYATANNAFHQRLYSGDVALLRAPVAARLFRVQKRLERQGYGLKIWDAYRPRAVQWTMWRLRPDARTHYLANPRKVSKHSRGAAVDVTLVTRTGRAIPMPTPHDEFSRRAHRGAQHGVSLAAQKNARILDTAMRAEGFRANPYEWWHFTAPEWNRYPASDIPVPGRPSEGNVNAGH